MIAVRRVKEGVVMIELHLLPVSKPQTGEYPIGAGSQPERATHCATRPAPRSLGVRSGHHSFTYQCPLYPSKRTKSGHLCMSALCQKRTSALQQKKHRYSITSSARASSDGGTVRPSTLAAA